MSRVLAIWLALVLASGPAVADDEPWYRGRYGRNRVTQVGVTLGLGLIWGASETIFKDDISPDTCRWCEPPSFDRSARSSLVWDNTGRAHFLSNLNVYAVSPVVAFGLLIASNSDASASRLIDDLLPIAESAIIGQLVTNVIKISVARQRPYARFGTSGEVSVEDNLSFVSGHSSFGFALTTSASLIAHWRGYKTAPYILGAGIALSLTTEYLRIAADKHYLSDVLAGGFVGIAAGLLVPRLMRRELHIVPVANGAAIAGYF